MKDKKEVKMKMKPAPHVQSDNRRIEPRFQAFFVIFLINNEKED